MTVVDTNCGNTIGMLFWTDDVNVPIGVYCSRDSGITVIHCKIRWINASYTLMAQILLFFLTNYFLIITDWKPIQTT